MKTQEQKNEAINSGMNLIEQLDIRINSLVCHCGVEKTVTAIFLDELLLNGSYWVNVADVEKHNKKDSYIERYEGCVNNKNFKVIVTIENGDIIQISAIQDGIDISQKIIKEKYIFHYENFKKHLIKL